VRSQTLELVGTRPLQVTKLHEVKEKSEGTYESQPSITSLAHVDIFPFSFASVRCTRRGGRVRVFQTAQDSGREALTRGCYAVRVDSKHGRMNRQKPFSGINERDKCSVVSFLRVSERMGQ
jgi:hypothetical protein